MAEQHPTNDMFDVLASIRRLVSEERTAPQRIEPVPPTAPVSTAPAPAVAAVEVAAASVSETDAGACLTFARSESRFVLTPALRVADEDGAVQPAAAPAAEAQSAPPAPEEFIAPQAPHAATAPVSETAAETASDFTHAAPSRLTQDLDALDQRAASLEETIAELEAAVADISSEFEPDGGEPIDIVAEYFPDEGEAPAPLLSDFAPDADENAPEPHPSFAQVRDLPLSQGPLVFTRDPSPAETEALAEARPGVVRPHGIMAGFDAMSSAPEDALDLPVTGEALIPVVLPPRAPQDEAAGWPEHRGSPFGGNARLEETVDQTVDEGAPEPEPEADEAPAPRSRLQILRPEMAETAVTKSLTPEPEEDVSEPDPELEAEDLAEPEMARVPAEPDRSALAAEPLAAATGAEDEPLPPLFDPLADADYDVDALRDIVAELVRDELRGALGERITRNIRALVRAEMKRILAEEA